MGRKSVPVKTKEGTQEIRARALGLAPRIRTALLLVDGVKSATELERLMAAAGVTPGALQLLLDKGLIRFPEEEPELPAEPAVFHDAARAMAAGEGDELLPPMPEDEHQPTVSVGATTVSNIPTLFELTQRLHVSLVPDEPRVPTPAQIKAPGSLPAVQREQQHRAPKEGTQEQKQERPQERAKQRAPDVAHDSGRIERVLFAPLEVVTLLQLETILGGATKMEVATILGVATMLELTPTQMMAPDTAVKMPPAIEAPRLPPLAQAQRVHELNAVPESKMVVPAAVLRMNLMAARAHLAAALDQHLEVEVYVLRQKIAACESREELERLYALIEGALIAKIDRSAATRILHVATAILVR